ncbi:MAG TPA: transcription antitermination factor NusB [Rhizomicrobium sp.]|nr:transcription antitermination factor NusB [Rhizomicrobium sp.]
MSSSGKIDNQARRTARLAAVQALYQMELAGAGAEEVAEEFVAHRFDEAPADIDFFKSVVEGVPVHQAEIDKAIAACLAENWSLARVDSILRAILRAGGFELVARQDVPARVVIDEYVGIAHDFFSGDEPGFVNAALDRMAHKKRAPEFGKPVPDDELGF